MEKSDLIIREFKVDGKSLEYLVFVTFLVAGLIISVVFSIVKHNTVGVAVKFFIYSPLWMSFYLDVYSYRYRVVQKMVFTQCHLVLTCRAKTYKLGLDQIEITKKSFGNSRLRKEFHIYIKSQKCTSRIKRLLSKEHLCFKALIEEKYICELEESLHELQVDYKRY